MHNDHHSLVQKLGYIEGDAVDTLNAPDWFLEYLRGNGIHTHAKLPAEWMHMFMTDRERTEHFMRHLKFNEIQKGLWMSWPKDGSGFHTDLSENALRDILDGYGWDGVESCDIDDHWHGLKFTERA